VIVEVYVQPGARRTELAGQHDGRMKIRLSARAVDGKANEALIEFLAGHFGVLRRSVSIEQGLTSRRKRVLIKE
jgi:uncharacterized protein (TIGR00251 family)